MARRIRYCVECPKCLTRYLIASSPYRNGSYLIPTAPYSPAEYILYCSCGSPAVSSRWRWSELKTYKVSKAAFVRGFGKAEEIALLDSQIPAAWVFGGTPHINRQATAKQRRTR